MYIFIHKYVYGLKSIDIYKIELTHDDENETFFALKKIYHIFGIPFREWDTINDWFLRDKALVEKLNQCHSAEVAMNRANKIINRYKEKIKELMVKHTVKFVKIDKIVVDINDIRH